MIASSSPGSIIAGVNMVEWRRRELEAWRYGVKKLLGGIRTSHSVDIHDSYIMHNSLLCSRNMSFCAADLCASPGAYERAD